MRRWMLGVAVALAAAGASGADEKATAVVKKAIDAHGGADRLNTYKAGKAKMSGVLVLDGTECEFTGDLTFNLPDRYKLHLSADVAGMKLTIDQVVKGESVKNALKIDGMAIPANGDDEVEELKMNAAQQEAEQFTPLLDAKRFAVTAADDEDVNGKKAAVIVVRPKALKKDFRMYFDKDSGLLLKSSHKTKEPGGDSEVVEEVFYEDYKKVKGIQVAMKQRMLLDGKKFLDAKLTDYELMEKIDDKEFTLDD